MSKGGNGMSDWNEQAAPNNNLPPSTIRSSLTNNEKQNHEKTAKKGTIKR